MSRGNAYKIFKGCDPPSFDGKKGAMAAFHWIHEMGAVVELNGCTETEAVTFAARSFKSEALFWWDNVKQSRGPAKMAIIEAVVRTC